MIRSVLSRLHDCLGFRFVCCTFSQKKKKKFYKEGKSIDTTSCIASNVNHRMPQLRNGDLKIICMITYFPDVYISMHYLSFIAFSDNHFSAEGRLASVSFTAL